MFMPASMREDIGLTQFVRRSVKDAEPFTVLFQKYVYLFIAHRKLCSREYILAFTVVLLLIRPRGVDEFKGSAWQQHFSVFMALGVFHNFFGLY